MADLTPAQREFRAAMANLSAGVNIVTTDGPRGRAGITVSAACSVTDEPPTMLVCVHRASRAHDVLAGNERVCVNVLGSGQQDLALRFAGATGSFETSPSAWRIDSGLAAGPSSPSIRATCSTRSRRAFSSACLLTVRSRTETKRTRRPR